MVVVSVSFQARPRGGKKKDIEWSGGSTRSSIAVAAAVIVVDSICIHNSVGLVESGERVDEQARRKHNNNNNNSAMNRISRSFAPFLFFYYHKKKEKETKQAPNTSHHSVDFFSHFLSIAHHCHRSVPQLKVVCVCVIVYYYEQQQQQL